MPGKALIIFFAIFLFALTACKKNTDPVKNNVKSAVDVYLAGSVVTANGNQVAAYWKNGTLTKLADSSYNSLANNITIAGSNVYITGWVIDPAGIMKAACWKNGERYYLSYGDTSLVGSNATSVAVEGSNIYVAGTVTLYNYIRAAVIWVNGSITYLGPAPGTLYDYNQNSEAYSVAVNGGNVYVTGEAQNTPGNGAYTAIYWLNGTAKSLADAFFSTSVSGLTFKGSDMYISGTITINGVNSPAYWKNDKLNTIAGLGNALSISVDGNNVYLGGTIINSSNNAEQAVYWKNGVQNLIGNAATLSYAYSISAYGNNLGIGGSFGGHPSSYWFNGNFIAVTGTSAVCLSIVLVPKL